MTTVPTRIRRRPSSNYVDFVALMQERLPKKYQDKNIKILYNLPVPIQNAWREARAMLWPDERPSRGDSALDWTWDRCDNDGQVRAATRVGVSLSMSADKQRGETTHQKSKQIKCKQYGRRPCFCRPSGGSHWQQSSWYLPGQWRKLPRRQPPHPLPNC